MYFLCVSVCVRAYEYVYVYTLMYSNTHIFSMTLNGFNVCENVFIFILIVVSWPAIVEGDSKTSFSIAPILRCRKGCYSFPWTAPLTLDPIMLSFKQEGIKYHFLRVDLGLNFGVCKDTKLILCKKKRVHLFINFFHLTFMRDCLKKHFCQISIII